MNAEVINYFLLFLFGRDAMNDVLRQGCVDRQGLELNDVGERH